MLPVNFLLLLLIAVNQKEYWENLVFLRCMKINDTLTESVNILCTVRICNNELYKNNTSNIKIRELKRYLQLCHVFE